MDSWFREIYVLRAWCVHLATGFDFTEKNRVCFGSIGVRVCLLSHTLPLYYEGKVKKTIFPQDFVFVLQGAIHSTKISGNFGLKVNGSVRSNRKSFEKTGPPFEVDLFSRLDRSDRNGPFHLTIPTHFQSQDLAVRYLPCTKWRKILITALLRIVNSRSIGVTRTFM